MGLSRAPLAQRWSAFFLSLGSGFPTTLNVRLVELFWYVVTHRGVVPALPHVPGGVGRSTINEAMRSLRTALGGKLYESNPFVLLPRAGRR